MSMLAEPRRKKAWVLNPRKSQWAEDESKFGQKMLEQMGWSKGKGLGRELTGITEHIRPSVQNDSRGLGYEGRGDDWVAHLDDFNDLLANLQQNQTQPGKTDEEEKKAGGDTNTNVKSLEERSKKSRARVHYHKFTRGKDLSRYSRQDLACILGGGGGGAASQPVTPVGSRPPSPPAQADSEPEPEQREDSSGYTTINTGLSVKDYFAAKMRKMKMLKAERLQKDADTETCGNKLGHEMAENVDLECPENDEDQKRGEKRLKKKKKRSLPQSEETCPAVPVAENVASEEPKKKKRKKSKEVVNTPEDSEGKCSEPLASSEISTEQTPLPPADSEPMVTGDAAEVPETKKKTKKQKKKKCKSKRSEDTD